MAVGAASLELVSVPNPLFYRENAGIFDIYGDSTLEWLDFLSDSTGRASVPASLSPNLDAHAGRALAGLRDSI